jgi:hypothetical protein
MWMMQKKVRFENIEAPPGTFRCGVNLNTKCYKPRVMRSEAIEIPVHAWCPFETAIPFLTRADGSRPLASHPPHAGIACQHLHSLLCAS